MKIGKILRENRSFRFYWASISFSHISGIMFNVISAYILLLHSPTFYSLVAGATMLMGSLIRFPAGYISDIVDRKRALTITRLSQAVLILAPIVSTNFIVVSFVGFNLLTSLNGPLSAGLVQSVMEKKTNNWWNVT
ncbi:MFS transporter [Metallosphaera hakonensis]|uniref:MFS transporter n=1 Tax=Metallosphaera hakonensis TaxID=79601 RepID=UPI0006D21D17|nr:MFS transporter [Metallosphaera hakonensis]